MTKERTFHEKLVEGWAQGRYVCVGIDPVLDKIRLQTGNTHYARVEHEIEGFVTGIAQATHDIALAYKPNIAFFEAFGKAGWDTLQGAIGAIRRYAPDAPIILDVKRADIGATNAGYVKAYFDELKVDAVTVHPYLGEEALKPFLERAEKGVFVLCRTSNQGAGEFQDLVIDSSERAPRELLYQRVARNVAEWHTRWGNVGLVVGATYPEEILCVRETVGSALPLLIPGVGTQGGDVTRAVQVARSAFLLNSSGGLLYPKRAPDEDFSEATRRVTRGLHIDIIQALEDLQAL